MRKKRKFEMQLNIKMPDKTGNTDKKMRGELEVELENFNTQG